MTIKSLLPLSLRARIADARGRGVYSGYADEHRCVFIHVPKAAGTSIALTLFNSPSRHVPWTEYYRANPGKFRRYFKFSFVRNPWNRLVSTYFFLARGGMDAADARWASQVLPAYSGFGDFVRRWVDEQNVQTWVHFVPQHQFVCDASGAVMVDFLGRMESIETDFARVAAKLGCTAELKKVNTGNQEHYSHYYDDETREIVRRVYRRDIELFGYDYETPVGAGGGASS